jgi:branched-chain amino acid transport system substrate-binding protein
MMRVPSSVAIGSLAALLISGAGTCAEDRITAPVKIGLVVPMTGGFNAIGRQVVAGARLYVQTHGDTVAGRKIVLIVRDDTSAPDVAKRIAQELIVNDQVQIIGGGITPTALTIAPLATQAKTAMVVIVSGASVVTERSPYVVRTSFTLGQSSAVIADWAAQNGSRKVVTLVSDWAPGVEAETAFRNRLLAGGGQIIEQLRVPLANPDFSPFLQRARDAAPDTLFVAIPGQQAAVFAKQFAERGLDKSGIRLIGPGDITDDDELNTMGDAVLGIVTAHNYASAHPSPQNRDYVAAFRQANGFRPNFISVGGYDGMHLIYEALKKTSGATDGDALVAAMKGMAWESPRGPIAIDPQTRDIVQNIYIRRVERRDGELHNIEFATYEAVKDPMKAGK